MNVLPGFRRLKHTSANQLELDGFHPGDFDPPAFIYSGTFNRQPTAEDLLDLQVC